MAKANPTLASSGIITAVMNKACLVLLRRGDW